jgi:hypothetical protein
MNIDTFKPLVIERPVLKSKTVAYGNLAAGCFFEIGSEVFIAMGSAEKAFSLKSFSVKTLRMDTLVLPLRGRVVID